MREYSIGEILDIFHWKITSGWKFEWTCFGPMARGLDVRGAGWACTIFFDASNLSIRRIEYFELGWEDNAMGVVWTHPDFRSEFSRENDKHPPSDNEPSNEIQDLEDLISRLKVKLKDGK